MAEGTQTGTDARASRMNGISLIGVGKHATVWRSADGAEARKRYIESDSCPAIQYAQREFSALKRAGVALASIPDVRSPRPYRIDSDRGELVMEYCDALPLHHALADRSFADRQAITDLAIAIGSGIAALTDELELDEVDFSVRNTLVSKDLSEVILIDFTIRPQVLPTSPNFSKLENALGSFLSSVVTYQLHRATLLEFTVSRRIRLLARDTVSSIATNHPLDAARVREIAWRYFWRQSTNRGWKRYLWFNTVGAVLFRALLRRITPEDEDRESATTG